MRKSDHKTKGTSLYVIKDRPVQTKPNKYTPHQGKKERAKRCLESV